MNAVGDTVRFGSGGFLGRRLYRRFGGAACGGGRCAGHIIQEFRFDVSGDIVGPDGQLYLVRGPLSTLMDKITLGT